MKTTHTLLLLLMVSFHMNGQLLVVDDPISGGNILPFQDTLLESNCNGIHKDYYFDLDQDSIADVKFTLFCYVGGFEISKYLTMETFNDFVIHKDDNYPEYCQIVDSLNQIQDTIKISSVVRKYNINDTIYYNGSNLSNTGTLLSYVRWYNPPVQQSNINLFHDIDSYISVEKIGGILYYFKIKVENGISLRLYNVRTNALIVDPVIDNIAYPNPTTGLINLNQSYESIEIYNTTGSLLMYKMFLDSENTIDLSILSRGLYIAVLRKNGVRYLTKLAKTEPQRD
jgi:hypothetical protein